MFKYLLAGLVLVGQVYASSVPSIGSAFFQGISNPWSVVASTTAESKLCVVYSNELGFKQEEFCRAVFEKGNEYKLVAPWLGIGKILQKSNITDLEIKLADSTVIKEKESLSR